MTAKDNAGDTKHSKHSSLELIRGDTLTPEAINWLWQDWLAASKFHLLAGRAGTGKTTLALSMAATISAGGSLPDGAPAQVGDVVIWSGEDGVRDTLVPRLLASGADMSRVHFVGGVSDGHGQRTFAPATDTSLLDDRLSQLPSAKLLIIDPVIVAVSGDSNKGGDVRRGLQPLADLAEKHGIAVLGITHFNKGMAGADPLDRVTGSLAFGAVARVVMGVASPKDPDGERRLVRLKSNIGTDEGGFGYLLEQTPVPSLTSGTAQTVRWCQSLTGAGRDLLAELETEQVEDVAKATKAKTWLTDILQLGAVSSETLRSKAAVEGLSWRTVQRAKDALGFKAKKRAMGAGWEWYKP